LCSRHAQRFIGTSSRLLEEFLKVRRIDMDGVGRESELSGIAAL